MQDIYDKINDLRVSPLKYKASHHSCEDMSGALPKLVVSTELQEAAEFQARSTLSCGELSDKTCHDYCYMFKSCSLDDRVLYFSPRATKSTIAEVLVYGPKDKFPLLLKSECGLLRDSTINSIGAGVYNSLLVLVFAKIV